MFSCLRVGRKSTGLSEEGTDSFGLLWVTWFGQKESGFQEKAQILSQGLCVESSTRVSHWLQQKHC